MLGLARGLCKRHACCFDGFAARPGHCLGSFDMDVSIIWLQYFMLDWYNKAKCC